jgi:uncharacterized membrane protein
MGGRNVPVELVVAAWPDPDAADKAMRELKEAKHEHLIGIVDLATVVVDADGKLRIKDTKDMGPGKGAVIGGLLGAGLGLLTGGVGWLLVGGGVVGGLAAKARDGGLPDAQLRALGERMTPNSSAIVAVIEDKWVADLAQEIAELGAEIVREAITADLADQLGRGSAVTYTAAEVEGDVVATRSVTTRQATPQDVATPQQDAAAQPEVKP